MIRIAFDPDQHIECPTCCGHAEVPVPNGRPVHLHMSPEWLYYWRPCPDCLATPGALACGVCGERPALIGTDAAGGTPLCSLCTTLEAA